MSAIFIPDGDCFRATKHAGGPWSPEMLQGSATTSLMAREVERLAVESNFAVRRLTFDLWRPAGLSAFRLQQDLKYVDSWVEPNFARCFQLMECDDLRLFQEWVLMWRGSGATFEIVPVVISKDTREVVAPHLEKL